MDRMAIRRYLAEYRIESVPPSSMASLDVANRPRAIRLKRIGMPHVERESMISIECCA